MFVSRCDYRGIHWQQMTFGAALIRPGKESTESIEPHEVKQFMIESRTHLLIEIVILRMNFEGANL